MTTKIKKVNFDKILKNIESIDTDTLIILADQKVWELYRKKLPLDKISNKKVIFRTLPSGEPVKIFSEYVSCCEFLLDKGVHRRAHIVALGGGSLSDFAGFVAATLLRGISWSVIPTTLLSMVDASIGGKTAINSKEGKNLIGSFHRPDSVWINTDFLDSLPEEELINGYGEVIKYAFLDTKISKKLLTKSFDLNELVLLCADFKLKLTEKDFKEAGIRKCLNLGHTLGHAIEKIYSIPHGEAVFWGIVLIFEAFQKKKLMPELLTFAKQLGIDKKPAPWHKKKFPVSKIMTYVKKDKKMTSKTSIELVLIEAVGQVVYKKIELTELESVLDQHKEKLSDFSL